MQKPSTSIWIIIMINNDSHYYMAGCASGQDKLNYALWKITQDLLRGKSELPDLKDIQISEMCIIQYIPNM